MSKWRQLRHAIKKRVKNSESKNSIGKSLGISAAEVGRILDGKYPGVKIAKRLGLPEICPFCKHRVVNKKVVKQTIKIGQPGWENLYLKKLG